MLFTCEHCGEIVETEFELEVGHRSCRLKATFPGAYTDRGDGLVTFDMTKVAESLGLFKDWIIDTKGQTVHPLDGDLHFRIGTNFYEPEVWIEVPVQVGNSGSSWAFRISGENWGKIASIVKAGLEAAKEHLARKKLEKE